MPKRRYTTKPERLTLAAVEMERLNFLPLLRLNPNYFGTLADSPFTAVSPISGNTTYEEVGCIGYDPHKELLHATVVIKQPYGYHSDQCGPGSEEYVRFFIWNEVTSAWENLGLTSFKAYNVAEGTHGHKDLDYAVTLNISPDKKPCFNANIVKVRAVLSWETIPPDNDPDPNIVWGEIQDAIIQIDKRFWFLLPELPDFEISQSLANIVDIDNLQLATKSPMKLTLAESHDLYKDTDVEPERYVAPALMPLLSDAGLQPLDSSPGDATFPTAAALELPDLLPDLNVDIGALLEALQAADGNTSYESLDCVGLDPKTSRLVGLLHIKRPQGYSGNLCTNGSTEYVAFWVDRNDGAGYQYVATASVKVYDFGKDFPAEGIHYGVSVPIDLDDFRAVCKTKEEVIWKVRGVLSWNTPPSTTNPDAPIAWGNRDEALIHIAPWHFPEPPLGFKPIIESISHITPDSFNATGYATGTAVGAGYHANQSPLGGKVAIHGHLFQTTDLSSGQKVYYRIEVKDMDTPGSNWEPLTNNFKLKYTVDDTDPTTPLFETVIQTTENGWYTYREDDIGAVRYQPVENLMGLWYTGDREGHWRLRILSTLNPTNPAAQKWTSEVVNIRLDNTAPDLSVVYTNECGDVAVGSVMQGTYSVSDLHLSHVRLWVEPGDKAAGGNFTAPAVSAGPSVGYHYPVTQTSDINRVWQLDTGGMEQCGYVLKVRVFDRTIVNSSYKGWRRTEVIGFCLRA